MTQWRNHPKLKGRFHPQAPDDLQIIAHDGGPRFTNRSPEIVWVTVTGVTKTNIYVGRVLNQPKHLSSIKQGSEILFIVPAQSHPILVTPKYLAERHNWDIQPCNKCGFDEMFDAPSDLVKAVFPGLPEDSTEIFSTFCSLCGGIQIVQHKDAIYVPNQPAAKPLARKWWEIWK